MVPSAQRILFLKLNKCAFAEFYTGKIPLKVKTY